MAAEVAVQLLWGTLYSLIEEHGKLLGGSVSRDVDDIKDDLETMRSFLKEADSRGETDQMVKTWVNQVRKVAYDTEDVLDEFLLRLVRPRNKHGIIDSLVNKLHDAKHLTTRHRLATEIQNIKARLKDISEKKLTFSFTDIGEGGITRENVTTTTWHDPRNASLYIDEAEVVGIEKSKNILIEWLTQRELELTIISVVGMGGLGKTTLVRKVYDSQMVTQHFNCRVWITISQSPVIRELLRTAIKEILKATEEQAPEGMDAMDVNELIQELNKQLSEKRYVIIFDDIWDINVWEAMKFAFPDNARGSRIIFTTRISNVAEHGNYIHNLEPLKEQEAWRLFCMKAFRTNHESSSGCPKELEELSRNILKKCGGLPLAIVLIGGLLARKAKTVREWKNVHDSVGAEMNYELDSLKRILLLSYNSLPYYLKPCFLYLSMFPEDYFIQRTTLIRLWIAEGFIEEKQGITMEAVAEGYVDELISRSMIQIAELNRCYEVKSCRIHDLMRETILLKSKEECFSTTITTGSHEEIGVAGLHGKGRRISIYHNKSDSDENYNNYPKGSRCSRTHSLVVFQLYETPYSFRRKFFRAFKLLRVLDLEGADLVEFPPELAKLIHLRYLSLRNTKIAVLPKSVGKLKNLETLDLKHTSVSKLPVEILNLQRLRHLLVYCEDYDLVSFTLNTNGVSMPTGIENLISLQTLSFLDVQHQVVRDGCQVLKELGKLTRLKRLGITNLRSEDGGHLCLSLQKMEHLSSLTIVARSTRKKVVNEEDSEEKEFLELELSSPPELLSRLFLDGRLGSLPSWIASLRNLTSLVISSSRLSCKKDDPLKAFQHLSNLVHLCLHQAYEGEELCCDEIGGYQKLKELFLTKMEGLKRVSFRKGSMPMLRELNIFYCSALEMVPHGIEHITSLQELRLVGLHPGLVERIKKKPSSPPQEAQGDQDCHRVQHIPEYYHSFYNTQGTLVTDKLL